MFGEIITSKEVYEFIARFGVFILLTLFSILVVWGFVREIRLRRELLITNKRLRELSERKSELVSIASHQLRSPLTAMKGYASMLLEGSFGKLSAGATGAVGKIFNSNNHLIKVVEDFLTLASMEQGQLTYTFTTVDLKKITKNIVDSLKPVVNNRNLEIIFEVVDEGRDYFVRADKNKIIQVIDNIVDNAIKCTKKGSIKVSLEHISRRDIVRIVVKDTGIGMSKETIETLFQKYSRAKDKDRANTSGTGLGLYIASSLVDAHGGKIFAESEGEGLGSTFFVELRN